MKLILPSRLRRVLLPLLCLTLCLALTACGSSQKETQAESTAAPAESTAAPAETPAESPAESSSETEPAIPETEAALPTVDVEGVPSYLSLTYDFHDYVKLGEYKGVSYTPVSTEVSEDEIQEQLDMLLQENASLQPSDKQVIENGDTVHILYTGYLDGVAFEGGASGEDGYDLTIGSHSFVGDFEEQLIGKQVGTTVTLNNVMFPDDYRNADLAGKATTFDVTIQYIGEMKQPELTDEFVAGLGYEGVETVEALREDIRSFLQEQKEASKEQDEMAAVLEAVAANAEITGYPTETVSYYENNLVSTYEQQAAAYQIDLATYVSYLFDVTEDEFRSMVHNAAEQTIRNEMIQTAVIAAEGMDLTDDEYADALADYAEEMGTTVTELTQQYEEANLKAYFLTRKVQDFLYENAVAAQP